MSGHFRTVKSGIIVCQAFTQGYWSGRTNLLKFRGVLELVLYEVFVSFLNGIR
jgi:hypothetical protein